MGYPAERKEAVLKKMLPPNNKTIKELAKEEGISEGTLHNWRKAARAWAIKENIRHLWRYKSLTWAERYWKKWYFWATHSSLEPIKKAAKTLKDHQYGIMNFFKHRISNGPVEGINSRIAMQWKAACGFRNKARLRTVILFHLGGLNLYPVTH